MDDALQALAPLLPALTPWAYMLALALARTAGVLLALPQLVGNKVPGQVKVVLALSIAASLLFVGVPPAALMASKNPELALVVAALGDFCLGLALGFFVHLALAAVRFAGELIGTEMGLSFAAVVDPGSQDSTTPVSLMMGQVAVQLFLLLGLDREVVRALAASVRVHPLGEAWLDGEAHFALLARGDEMLRTGVALALPIVGALFALKLSMAMLARVAPKIQIFALSFTLSILLGLLALLAAFPAMADTIAIDLIRAIGDLRDFASASARV